MAAKIGSVKGTYTQQVPDPDKDQSDEKFGPYVQRVKESHPKGPSQSSGVVKDSGSSHKGY
jgi:hypothetical protein